ncbi:MAG: hypothetical protein OEZ02_03095 [Anaerolineae bacterium]|nr:hypothetical protein [Anaerolineae bacterium]
MLRLINQNSFLIAIVIVFIVALTTVSRRGFSPQSMGLLAAIAAVLAGVFFSFRASPGTQESTTAVQTHIGQGTPVLIEVQSPF